MRVYQLIEESSIINENSVAVVFEEISITYKELMERVKDLANAILLNAPNEQFIGISATRSIEMIISVLAILKAGKTYLPLDTNYPSLRLKQLIEDSNIKFTLCLTEENDFFNNLGLSFIAADKTYDLQDIAVPFYSPIVCILYTSGSTGKPKGVCLGQQGLINQVNWQKGNGIAKQGVRTLQYCHLSFDAAFQEIFVPLSTGGTLYIVNDTYRLNTGNLLHFIENNKINRLFLPYAVVQFLSETAHTFHLYPTSLKEIITGGELLRITPQIANFFDVLSDCILMNVYGPTEASVWVTELKLKGNALIWPFIPTIGSPSVGAEIFIADQHLQLLPNGEEGEILIYGDCLALGYLNKPEQTAERFIQWQHPELGEIRVYRTGDLAIFNDDNTLKFMGRRDEQVKIRGGNRVELGEIAVVISNMSGISQVQVMVREDVPDQKKIVAYIIASNNTITAEEIKKQIASQLPDYMIPSSIVFLKEFPLTVSGKIDKASLPAPDNLLSVDPESVKRATNKEEAYLLQLWEELLHLKNISISDNFFDLGGNSLIAIQMIIRMEKDLGKQLPLVSFFLYPNIEKLAKSIKSDIVPTEFSPLVAIKPSGNRPPVYLVHGDNLNVLNFSGIGIHIHPEQPVYGLQPKGLDGNAEAFDSMEDIAHYYNEAILLQNPTGPYSIAGYSFGGYVAFEMAKQLKSMGKSINILGILDTNVLNAENNLSWDKQLIKKIMRQFPKILWIAKSFFTDPKQVHEYQIEALINRLREIFHLGTRPNTPGTEAFHLLRDQINKKHNKALQNYTLEKYDGEIVLFKGRERPYFVDDFKYLGWSKYAMKGVNVHTVPGNHETMFIEPNCKILAGEIDKALAGIE